jgi:hypothetical protein
MAAAHDRGIPFDNPIGVEIRQDGDDAGGSVATSFVLASDADGKRIDTACAATPAPPQGAMTCI